MHGVVEAELHAILSSALRGACRLTSQGKSPSCINRIGSWVGPRAGLDAVAKRKIPIPCRELNSRCPVRILVTILTELPKEVVIKKSLIFHVLLVTRIAKTDVISDLAEVPNCPPFHPVHPVCIQTLNSGDIDMKGSSSLIYERGLVLDSECHAFAACYLPKVGRSARRTVTLHNLTAFL
jgi:hypothetical protein